MNTSNSPREIPSQKQTNQPLEDWIKKFISTFKESRLKTVLETCNYLRSSTTLGNDERKISGLTVAIRPLSWDDFKFLASKEKQLKYRIKKADPEAEIFVITAPDMSILAATILTTGEKIAIRTTGRTTP